MNVVDILKTKFKCVSYDQSGSLENYREKVLKLHNDYRNQKGLPEYELNERVGQLSQLFVTVSP